MGHIAKLRTEFGLETAAPRQSVYSKLQEYFKAKGFKEEENTVKETTRRYVKRGFYDGDFPNAHQTNVTTKHSTFTTVDLDGKKKKEVIKFITDLGIKAGYKYSYKDRAPDVFKKVQHFNKGKSISLSLVVKTLKRPTLTVHFSTESTKPDKEFDRSGQGIGQII